MAGGGEIEGVDGAAVTGWLVAREPTVRPPLRFEIIAGGRSNLTYRVTDAGGQAFVLRRPPLGTLLASAHDMAREHRIMSALGPSPVPVPPVVGLCRDETVNAAPFYVMRHVDGVVLRDVDAAGALPEPVRGAAAEHLVDTLVELHRLDPDDVGLGDLGRKDGYVERLLRRWRGQWAQSQTRDVPLIEEVAERLARRVPPQGPARIVHGDYRLDNAIVDAGDGTVLAVLDWELCTLGDPLADVGLLLVYWAEPADTFSPLGDAPTLAPGFPGRDEIAGRYARGSGRDLSEIDFYVALGLWKLAVISEGVYARYVAGAYGGGDDPQWGRFGEMVPHLAEAAHAAAARAGR